MTICRSYGTLVENKCNIIWTSGPDAQDSRSNMTAANIATNFLFIASSFNFIIILNLLLLSSRVNNVSFHKDGEPSTNPDSVKES